MLLFDPLGKQNLGEHLQCEANHWGVNVRDCAIHVAFIIEYIAGENTVCMASFIMHSVQFIPRESETDFK